MDCLVAALEYNKDYYSDGTLKPEESLFFSITIMPFDNSINYQVLINKGIMIKKFFYF